MEKVSYIYIIGNGNDYKVGVSVNPEKRIKQLQTGSAQKLALLEKFSLPEQVVYKLEKECHVKLQSHYMKRGEWFAGANPWHVRVLIEEICEKYLLDKD
jgi:hypothetical protein